jgi:hypothetical protein
MGKRVGTKRKMKGGIFGCTGRKCITGVTGATPAPAVVATPTPAPAPPKSAIDIIKEQQRIYTKKRDLVSKLPPPPDPNRRLHNMQYSSTFGGKHTHKKRKSKRKTHRKRR